MDTILEKKKGLQKKHLPYVIGGAVLVIALIWLIFGNHSSRFNVEKNKVIMQTATTGEFNDYIRVNGQVQPINTIQLSAIEGGMVAEKVVEEGAMVHQGEVIVRLTNPMLSLNILDSEAQLAEKQNFLRNTQVTMEQERLSLRKEKLQLDLDIERKQRKYEQYKNLYNEKLTSKEEFLQAKEDYEFAVKGSELVIERQ
jgi:HlyD family secretion protein